MEKDLLQLNDSWNGEGHVTSVLRSDWSIKRLTAASEKNTETVVFKRKHEIFRADTEAVGPKVTSEGFRENECLNLQLSCPAQVLVLFLSGL